MRKNGSNPIDVFDCGDFLLVLIYYMSDTEKIIEI